MRILHIINNLQRGGAESMLIKLLKYSNQQKIIVFNLIGQNIYNIDQKKTILINFNFKTYHIFVLFYNVIKLIYLLYKYKPRSMIFWLYHSCFLSILIKIFYFKKVNYFWNIRQTVPDFKYEKFSTKIVYLLCRIFSNLPNGIIFNSKNAIESHKKYGFKNKNIIYIPNGFEPPFYSNNISKSFIETIKNKFVVAIIARYHLSKGHDIFIKSIKHLKNNKDIFFIMAGKNVNYKNLTLNKLIIDEGIENNLLLLDQLSNVNDYLKHTDLLVNCSISSEGFPNIIGEAILNGCICIASDISDNGMILNNNLLIIKNLNELTLANKIQSIYDLKSMDRMNIKENLKKIIQSQYSIDKITKIYDSI